MAGTILKLVAGAFVALIVTMDVSAQSETCAMKAENTQCAVKSECCSRCCLAGLCSREGNCFAACDTSIIATAEGPDLCKLTKSIDELTDLIETVVNEDLSTGIPLLSDIIAIAELFLKNPIAGLSSINDVIKDSQTLEKLLNTSGTEIRRIMDVSNTIINELINVINKLIPNPQ